MAHAYAARLGCIALIFGLAKTILDDGSFASGVATGLTLLFIFAVAGFLIGGLTESLIRQSLEVNFRRRVENYRMQAKKAASK
jgi:hypothetical protein